MTGSGIYGTLVEVSEAMVLLQVAPGVEIKIARRAIASQVVDPAVTETDVSGKTDDEDSDEEDSNDDKDSDNEEDSDTRT